MKIKNLAFLSLLALANLEIKSMGRLRDLGYTGTDSDTLIFKFGKSNAANAQAAIDTGLLGASQISSLQQKFPGLDPKPNAARSMVSGGASSQPQSSIGGASSEESSDLSGDDAQAAVFLSRAQSTRSNIKSQLALARKNSGYAKTALPFVATHMSYLQTAINDITDLPATNNQQLTLGQAQEIWIETVSYADEIRRLAAAEAGGGEVPESKGGASGAGGAAAHVGGGASGWAAVPDAAATALQENANNLAYQAITKLQQASNASAIGKTAVDKALNDVLGISIVDATAGGAYHRSKTLGRLGKDKIKKHTKKAKATKRNQYA